MKEIFDDNMLDFLAFWVRVLIVGLFVIVLVAGLVIVIGGAYILIK